MSLIRKMIRRILSITLSEKTNPIPFQLSYEDPLAELLLRGGSTYYLYETQSLP